MRRCSRQRTMVLLCCVLAVAASRAHARLASDEPLIATWESRQLTFQYNAQRTFYTCSALRHRLAAILTRVGARDDLRVDDITCDEANGFARFAISLSMPVVASAETVQRLTTYDTRQQMVARLRGESLPSAQDLPRFEAQWQTISFANDPGLKLAPGDCELVEQVRRKLLPRLDVRVIRKEAPCELQVRGLRPGLTVQALVQVAREPQTTDPSWLSGGWD